MVENKNQVRFGLWLPRVGDWPLSGSIKEKSLTDLSAFLGAAEHHGDVVRVSIFPNDRKENERHPDYNVLVSIAGERKAAQPQSRTQQPAASDNDDDSNLPF